MQSILVAAVLTIAAVFAGITTLIVLGKVWREVRDGWRRSRQRVLEPKILAWAHGDTVSLIAALGGEVAATDRHVVESILMDHVQRVRGIEKERLGRALDELGYVDRDLGRLRSRRWWARADAAENLGLAGAARATDSLVAAMNDPAQEVRLRAAKALGAVGGRTAIRPLIGALSEPNRWSSIRIADILTAMGPGVVDELMDAWDGLNPHARVAALDILGRIRSLATVPFLRARLVDADADIRARAAHAIGAIADPASGPFLVPLLKDAAWPVRAMAAKAIGRCGFGAAIQDLCGALRDPEWWVRANAAEALRVLGPAGLDALEGMLADPDVYARHQAVIVLQETGVLDRRLDELAGEDPTRAERLVRLFVQAGQVGRLRELAEWHADKRVRAALSALLPPAPGPARASR